MTCIAICRDAARLGTIGFVSLKAIGVSLCYRFFVSLLFFKCLPPTRVSRQPPVFPLVLRFIPLLLLILLTILCLLHFFRLQQGPPLSLAPLIRPHPVWGVGVFTLALHLIIQAARICPRNPAHQVMCRLRYLIPQRVSMRQHQRERSILSCISSAIWVPHLPPISCLSPFPWARSPLRLKSMAGVINRIWVGYFDDPITSVLPSFFFNVHMSTYADTNFMSYSKG